MLSSHRSLPPPPVRCHVGLMVYWSNVGTLALGPMALACHAIAMAADVGRTFVTTNLGPRSANSTVAVHCLSWPKLVILFGLTQMGLTI